MSSKSSNSEKSGGTSSVRQRLVGGALLAGLAVAAVVAIQNSRAPKPAAATPVPTSNQPTTTAATAAASFKPLEGRWMRPDGGYVLEIKRAAEDGQLEAAYYNPQPIHVSRARASRLGTYLKVEVELQDVGYPGCLYTLLMEPDKPDVLRGTYYQAAMQQTYDIQFERLKE